MKNTDGSVRDQQRSHVYAWERAHIADFYTIDLTLEECRTLIEKVCADYQKSVPLVTDGRGTRRAHGNAQCINLPQWARSTPIVLHELAHCILNGKMRSGTYAGHGPEFMRLFLDLLVKYAKLPARELRASATKAGLKVAPLAACPRPIDREEKRLRAEVRAARLSCQMAEQALHDYLKTKGKSG